MLKSSITCHTSGSTFYSDNHEKLFTAAADITFGSETIWLKLKDGPKEPFDLDNKSERKKIESKYRKLKHEVYSHCNFLPN